MQKIPAMFFYELGSAELINCMVKVFGHTFGKIRKFDAAFQGIDREAVLCKGVIPVPDKVILGLPERWPDPLILVLKDGLIPCDNCPEYRLGHLGFKPEFPPECGVKRLVKRKLLQVVGAEHIARHIITGIRISRHGFIKQNLAVCINRYLDFSRDCHLFHKQNPTWKLLLVLYQYDRQVLVFMVMGTRKTAVTDGPPGNILGDLLWAIDITAKTDVNTA